MFDQLNQGSKKNQKGARGRFLRGRGVKGPVWGKHRFSEDKSRPGASYQVKEFQSLRSGRMGIPNVHETLLVVIIVD